MTLISTTGPTRFQNDRPVAVWLMICAITVFAMVVLGGVTRLTDSGLSMVDWQPIMGVIPPLSEQDWQDTFEQYKQFPEYQKVNLGMSLEDFKPIFWFEYAHRVLGRTIGLVFGLPLAFFLIRRQLSPSLTWKLLGLFVLGGLQGLMGWYMVKSGLVDDPMVSQYRLTAHLALAVVIFAGILWLTFDLRYGDGQRPGSSPAVAARWAITGLVLVMILSGGFVAGTRAGLLFGTWPLMGEHFFPAGLYAAGFFESAFEDPVTIQFNHRMLAYITAAALIWFAITHLRMRIAADARRGLYLMLGLLGLQIGLGIATILFRVPVALGATHQGVALLLLAAVLFSCHRLGAR